jgi:D-lactate dehydrogenase (cytochrome)
VAEDIALVRAISRKNYSGEFIFAMNQVEQQALWSARKEALWSMLALRDERDGNAVWSTDVCVPLSRLPDMIGTCAHGNVHARFFLVVL